MILVDASHLFFRNFWMNKQDIIEYKMDDSGKKVPSGEINEGYIIFLIYRSILKVAREFNAADDNKLVIAVDSKPSWRHEYYVKHSVVFPEYENETYKGNRKKHEDLPFDKIMKALHAAIKGLELYSDFIPLKCDLCEADDIIAIMAKHANEDVFVYSSDKDFHQLQSENVHIFDPLKGILIPKMDVERHKKIHHICAGDDNIKAVKPRCAEKTAEKMLAEGLDDILKSNPDIKARYEFNQTLIDFDFIPNMLTEQVLLLYNKQKDIKNHNPAQLMNFFVKYQLKTLVGRIGEFKTSNKKYVKPKIIASKENMVTKVAETSIEDFFS